MEGQRQAEEDPNRRSLQVLEKVGRSHWMDLVVAVGAAADNQLVPHPLCLQRESNQLVAHDP